MKVTVGGTTVNVIMYYSLAAQIAGILPSKTPAGTGTLTVTYNGLDSATVPIVVVPNNIGVFTLNTTGSGDAVATLPATNTVVSPTNAPNPGEIITLWATGLGAVSGDESQPAQQADLTNIPLKVFIAGQPADVLFRGRNACCSGVDTIYVTVPQGLTGCANSVIMQIGNLVSNATSIPIGTNGRSCVPNIPNQTGGGLGSGTHSFGGLSLVRQATNIPAIGPVPAQSIKMDLIGGAFEKVTSAGSAQGSEIDVVSYGSCVVSTRVSGQAATPSSVTAQFLDAGTITVNGAGIAGNRQIAKTSVAGTLIYGVQLDSTKTPHLPPAPITLRVRAAPMWDRSPPVILLRRHSVGPINPVSQPLFAPTAPRSLGPEGPGGLRYHSGREYSRRGHGGNYRDSHIHLYGRVSDGSFTVPPVVLLAMPPTAAAPGATFATPGTLSVTHIGTTVTQIQATGIEIGGIGSVFAFGNSATYQ
jgi:uncharacterized protein (TIGR03437 family)